MEKVKPEYFTEELQHIWFAQCQAIQKKYVQVLCKLLECTNRGNRGGLKEKGEVEKKRREGVLLSIL